jgi:S-adenosylhomocysteine hydrolase
MDGFRVVRIEDILSKVDIVIAATGNKHIITREREFRERAA